MNEKNINDGTEDIQNDGVNNSSEEAVSNTVDAPEGEKNITADTSFGKEEADTGKVINPDSHNDTSGDNATEEIPIPPLDDCDTPKIEPSTYAFRWDYNEQKRHDATVQSQRKSSHGVAVYATILTVTFLIAVTLLVCTLLFSDYFQGSTPREPMQYSDALALDELYDYCLPSYVAISVVTNSGTEGVGSGIIITEDGYISTNYHVVDDAKKITVVTSSGKKYDAQYIDGDEVNDIAVIKVSAKKLTPAVLGSSSDTKVGERVMAIGTPYSISYAGSMTAGYVSGIERQYAVKNDNGTVNKILKLIQTDTSVNPGNSGGPLFNMNGEVIGVVVLKIAGTNYEGMGFALPIDGVKDIIFDIIENGKITDENSGSAVQGAALGISGHAIEGDKKYLMTASYCIEVLTDDEGDYINWSTGIYVEKIYVTDTKMLEAVGLDGAYPYNAPCTGVMIKTTSAGFDANEKLKFEDVIVSANGTACDTMSTLQEIILNSRVGDVLHLEVFRDGSYIFVDVELGLANSME